MKGKKQAKNVAAKEARRNRTRYHNDAQFFDTVKGIKRRRALQNLKNT